MVELAVVPFASGAVARQLILGPTVLLLHRPPHLGCRIRCVGLLQRVRLPGVDGHEVATHQRQERGRVGDPGEPPQRRSRHPRQHRDDAPHLFPAGLDRIGAELVVRFDPLPVLPDRTGALPAPALGIGIGAHIGQHVIERRPAESEQLGADLLLVELLQRLLCQREQHGEGVADVVVQLGPLPSGHGIEGVLALGKVVDPKLECLDVLPSLVQWAELPQPPHALLAHAEGQQQLPGSHPPEGQVVLVLRSPLCGHRGPPPR